MGVEHFGAIGPNEALDVGVLIGLTWLDVVNRHATFGAPIDKALRREFKAAVDSKRGRTAVDGDQLVDHTRDAAAGQGHADRNPKPFTIPFIDHRRQPHAPAVVERFSREVERPGHIEPRRRSQGLPHPTSATE